MNAKQIGFGLCISILTQDIFGFGILVSAINILISILIYKNY